jgi:hypothetical protein
LAICLTESLRGNVHDEDLDGLGENDREGWEHNMT